VDHHELRACRQDRRAGGDPAPDAEKPVPAIDPALYRRDDVRRILAALDIGALYRILQDAGVSQRQIAGLTGQSQSEVSEIVAGHRTVESHQLLKRIATGLGIPPELMGLSWWGPDGTWYGSEGAYPDEVMVADPPEGVEEEMRRRAVILSAPVALWGHPLFGKVPELPAPDWLVGALPSRLGMMHVAAVTDLLTQLRAWARGWGGQAEVLGAVAVQSMRLLTVPGEDKLRARLGSVLAELHTEAGWTYFDSGADDAANWYYCRALAIARRFGDRYQMAHALRHAGMLPLERGRFNDSLKLFQLGQIAFMPLDRPRVGNDPRIPPMTACRPGRWPGWISRITQGPSSLQPATSGKPPTPSPRPTPTTATRTSPCAWVNSTGPSSSPTCPSRRGAIRTAVPPRAPAFCSPPSTCEPGSHAGRS
jgi:transcriptional regulator with XRE-family HTH domain